MANRASEAFAVDAVDNAFRVAKRFSINKKVGAAEIWVCKVDVVFFLKRQKLDLIIKERICRGCNKRNFLDIGPCVHLTLQATEYVAMATGKLTQSVIVLTRAIL